MAYDRIQLRKLTPTIGAEIFGVDLAQPLTDSQFEEIHQALMENLVIFFRDQKLTVEQHKAFGARFGKLHIHPNAPKGLPSTPRSSLSRPTRSSKRVAGEAWHSDVSCDEEPPMGSILYIHEVPPDGGGDTMFANMYQAYETLSEPMRKMLDGLTAIHDRRKAHIRAQARRRQRHAVSRAPSIRGARPSLYWPQAAVCRSRLHDARRAVEPGRKRRAACVSVSAHRNAKAVLRFKWEKYSIAFWDNRCAQHQAIFDYWPHRRYGHRVTISGDRPFGVAQQPSNAELVAG